MQIKKNDIYPLLYLAESLEERREDFARTVVNANERIFRFAELHNWQHKCQPLTFKKVEIFSSQNELWGRLLQLFDMSSDTPLQISGLAAALEKEILMAISPEEYLKLRPEYACEEKAWEKLLAHEIAHRLHVRILENNEEAMGPTWFFEGFAIHAAGQKISNHFFDSPQKAIEAVRERNSSRGLYATYSSAFNYFLKYKSLKEMVSRAGKKDFENWLLTDF